MTWKIYFENLYWCFLSCMCKSQQVESFLEAKVYFLYTLQDCAHGVVILRPPSLLLALLHSVLKQIQAKIIRQINKKKVAITVNSKFQIIVLNVLTNEITIKECPQTNFQSLRNHAWAIFQPFFVIVSLYAKLPIQSQIKH